MLLELFVFYNLLDGCYFILRQGIIAFSVMDIQEIDAIISGLDSFEMKEAGPLILTWAVFLCLVLSLPEKQEYDILMVLHCFI